MYEVFEVKKAILASRRWCGIRLKMTTECGEAQLVKACHLSQDKSLSTQHFLGSMIVKYMDMGQMSTSRQSWKTPTGGYSPSRPAEGGRFRKGREKRRRSRKPRILSPLPLGGKTIPS